MERAFHSEVCDRQLFIVCSPEYRVLHGADEPRYTQRVRVTGRMESQNIGLLFSENKKEDSVLGAVLAGAMPGAIGLVREAIRRDP